MYIYCLVRMEGYKNKGTGLAFVTTALSFTQQEMVLLICSFFSLEKLHREQMVEALAQVPQK